MTLLRGTPDNCRKSLHYARRSRTFNNLSQILQKLDMKTRRLVGGLKKKPPLPRAINTSSKQLRSYSRPGCPARCRQSELGIPRLLHFVCAKCLLLSCLDDTHKSRRVHNLLLLLAMLRRSPKRRRERNRRYLAGEGFERARACAPG